MRRRRSKGLFHEPSLVPLADMLTNTVGIMLFILVLAVLAAKSAVLLRRLPIEHVTEKRPLDIVCCRNMIMPFDGKFLRRQFLEPLGTPKSDEEREKWISNFELHEFEGPTFTVSGRIERDVFGQPLRCYLLAVPTGYNGEPISRLSNTNSSYWIALAENNPQEFFLRFWVRQDSIEAFQIARALGTTRFHYLANWTTMSENTAIRMTLFDTSIGSEGSTSNLTNLLNTIQ